MIRKPWNKEALPDSRFVELQIFEMMEVNRLSHLCDLFGDPYLDLTRMSLNSMKWLHLHSLHYQRTRAKSNMIERPITYHCHKTTLHKTDRIHKWFFHTGLQLSHSLRHRNSHSSIIGILRIVLYSSITHYLNADLPELSQWNIRYWRRWRRNNVRKRAKSWS